MTTGRWLAASIALGRPVPVDERYPHICGVTLTGLMTAATVRLRPRQCAACAVAAAARGDPAV
ncbi:hypothetical protein OOK41_01260 [Micromonospora sp. NBC_01655]|uniref:hypothetical protein n=1 Tax=Micromonospora sp. NBC_01655 TaxID=2975983 RepID=UPI002253DCD9|nr:hypothetical protein [Micromonospora sp. NBC_01655]MCX4468952.1 hypothetical protein [Micromonospora sp. NBC_01655]